MTLRRLPLDAVPDLPAEPAAAMRASEDVVRVLYGRRCAESTSAALVSVARAVALGAWT